MEVVGDDVSALGQIIEEKASGIILHLLIEACSVEPAVI